MRSAAPQNLRSGKAARKSSMKFRTSCRPRRGACSEYWSSMSGAASSSMICGFHGLPQNPSNQRPTRALFSCSRNICVSPDAVKRAVAPHSNRLASSGRNPSPLRAATAWREARKVSIDRTPGGGGALALDLHLYARSGRDLYPVLAVRFRRPVDQPASAASAQDAAIATVHGLLFHSVIEATAPGNWARRSMGSNGLQKRLGGGRIVEATK